MSQIPPTEADVIIVGAGPVGLVSACELARHGVHCRIIEKRVAPTNYSQACMVHSQTQEIFEATGLLNSWTHNGYPIKQIVATAAGKRLGVLYLHDDGKSSATPRMIGQNIIERLLIEHLKRIGIKVERPRTVIGFEQDDDGVSVTLLQPDDSHEVIHARWLISADGVASLIRKTLGIPFVGERYAQMDFIQADARIRWSFPHGEGRVFLTSERFVGCFPFNADGDYRILCTHGHNDVLHNETPTQEEIQTTLRSVSDPEAEVYDVQWLNRLHPQRRKAMTFRQGRTFLVGDAAHTYLPIASHGMNAGIQDAFNLCWKLAAVIHHQAHPTLLDSYNTERQSASRALLYGTDLGFKFLAQPAPMLSGFLKTIAPIALQSKTWQHTLRALLAENTVHYKDGPLVVNTGGSGTIQAGERAVDAPIVQKRDMRTMRLFEILQGTHWTLLFFSGKRHTNAETQHNFARLGQEVKDRYRMLVEPHLVVINPDTYIPWGGSLLIDRDYALHNIYGVQDPCIYLIRPDLYVGFHGQATDSKHLLAYLASILHEQRLPTEQTRPVVTF